MFKKIRDTLLIVLTLVLTMSCASSAPFRPTDLNAVMEDMERKAYLVRQFLVQFVKTRSVPVFDRKLTVNGRLIFQKPAKTWLTLTGDVNVEILSDGKFIKIVHDNKDVETYHVRGDRDMTKFADPLMLLIDSIGNGGLRNLTIKKTVRDNDSSMVQIDPANDSRFERIKTIFLWFSNYGEIERVRIVFKHGGSDDTVFKSWRVLSGDAPEILKLNEKLRTLSTEFHPGRRDNTRAGASNVDSIMVGQVSHR